MKSCATFNSQSALRDYYVTLDIRNIEIEAHRVAAMRVFGPAFLSVVPCHKIERQIAAFTVRHFGHLAETKKGKIVFFPDWHGLKVDNPPPVEGLNAFGACFCPGTPLESFFIRLFVFPKGTTRVRDKMQYTGIGDIEDANRARYLMDRHFARNTFELCPLDEVGNKRCLFSLVDNGQQPYAMR